MLNKQSGFTLIELLVVIAIIGILSAIVLASLGTAKSKGTTASNQVAEQQIKNALALYASDHDGNYPANTNALVVGKYISAINPSIVYSPVDFLGEACTTETEPCSDYTLSISSGGGGDSGGGSGEDSCSHDATDPDCWSADQGSLNWTAAGAACADLGSGFRLPTVDELTAGLTAQFLTSPPTVTGFAGYVTYWSSTVYNATQAYLASYSPGSPVVVNRYYAKSFPLLVRCIR